jgi:F-type H+-transporting ATPase subunit delta
VRNTKLANRYSRALLDLSKSQDKLDLVNENINYLIGSIESSKELSLLLKSPIIDKAKKRSILSEIFKNFDKLTLQFIDMVLDNKRESNLLTIAKEFALIYDQSNNIQNVTVVSAVALDNATKDKIKSITSGSTNKKINLIESLDPNLIGGFVLRIGDLQYDASVSTKIRKMKQELIS